MTAGMSRKAKFTEAYPARFPPGTFERITPLLGATEDRADFVREAVEREIGRREKSAKLTKAKP